MSKTITTLQGTTMTLRHPNLDKLLSKHILLETEERKKLVSELSLDDKRYLGNYMLDNELVIHSGKVTPKAVVNTDELKRGRSSALFDASVLPEVTYRGEQHPLDGVLNFGNTTYEDGVEVFVNNKE